VRARPTVDSVARGRSDRRQSAGSRNR
jgi:hypothetical protein